MPTLRIAGHPPVAMDGRATLLQAALAAGIPIPFGCRSGLCGACRVRLVDGAVDPGRYGPGALSAAERARGLVLACRARPLGDVRIALPAAAPTRPPARRFAARVARTERLGRMVLGLELEPPPGGFAFLPGQYATIGFAGADPRDFSFAGLPGDPVLSFHLRLTGRDATADAALRLTPGNVATVEGPFGVAHFHPDDPGPLLLVAAGTGLAPMVSVARAALAADPDRTVRLFRVRPEPDDPYGTAELGRIATGHARFAVVETEPGRLVAAVAAAGGGATVHAAGPPTMVAALRAALADTADPPAVLRSDAFTPVG